MSELTCGLDFCFLCRHCLPEWKELVAIKKKTIFIKKGKPLFREGEYVQGIFFIYSGSVKIHTSWTEGKEIIIRWATAGDIAGHRGLGDEIYPISATALEDTTVCFISNEFLEVTLKANPSLTYKLLQFYASELQRAERRMRNLVHMEVKGRIAGALADLVTTFGTNKDGEIAINLTRQDIASYAGTTYETVFKFFTDLTRTGILSTSGKSIRIIDPDRLKAYTE